MKFQLNTDRLIECRLKLGISKNAASKLVRVSQPAYLRYESGTRTPSIQTIEEIAKVFNTSTDYLLGLTDDSSPDTIMVKRAKTPLLFELVTICEGLGEKELEHVLAYCKKVK